MPEPDWSIRQPVQFDQALRYATVSGDDNPIHTDGPLRKQRVYLDVSSRFVYDGVCSAGFDQPVLCGGPGRLKRLAVRWARPVFPGDTLCLKVWAQEMEAFRFTRKMRRDNW